MKQVVKHLQNSSYHLLGEDEATSLCEINLTYTEHIETYDERESYRVHIDKQQELHSKRREELRVQNRQRAASSDKGGKGGKGVITPFKGKGDKGRDAGGRPHQPYVAPPDSVAFRIDYDAELGMPLTFDHVTVQRFQMSSDALHRAETSARCLERLSRQQAEQRRGEADAALHSAETFLHEASVIAAGREYILDVVRRSL